MHMRQSVTDCLCFKPRPEIEARTHDCMLACDTPTFSVNKGFGTWCMKVGVLAAQDVAENSSKPCAARAVDLLCSLHYTGLHRSAS